MNDMLSKKELDDALYKETSVQFYVKTTVEEVIHDAVFRISWRLDCGNIWWETIAIGQDPNEIRFPFHISKFDIHDVDDGRLDKILCHYADYVDDLGYSFVLKENVIKAIRAFTIVLIKNWV